MHNKIFLSTISSLRRPILSSENEDPAYQLFEDSKRIPQGHRNSSVIKNTGKTNVFLENAGTPFLQILKNPAKKL